MRVAISPTFPKPDAGDGGIRRVVDAEIRHLPAYDIEVTNDQRGADVVQIHAMAMIDTDAPIVASTHGLYWTADQHWPLWAWSANADVLEVVRRAKLVTAPSEWVANSFRRGMLVDPVVIGHGVDLEDWEPGENGGYVLWNKARTDVICDPVPLQRLAAMAPEIKFVSTFGQKTNNLSITGRVPFDQMKPLVRSAAIYLATPKETFGIGTLEAMAAGVPVLGWRWGGQVDIVEHLETGYLAHPGNYQDLLEGLRYCLQNRERLGAAARQAVIDRYQWKDVVGQYASVMRLAGGTHVGPKVSVIVTCYKLEEYLGDCLASLQGQTMRDWEVIVVDDCSPIDENRNCGELVAEYAAGDRRIRYIRNAENLYLAEARNVGIRAAKGKYIIPLDADDMLHERTLETLSAALDKYRELHIAYGAFELIEPDGRHWVSDWPPQKFDWNALMAERKNQNPYCSMYRREVWERTGGYRRRLKTAEDADFWVRASSYGFRPAKVTDAVTLIYRNRPESMSHQLATPDFCAWSPWAERRELTPYGSIGVPAQGKKCWPISAFDEPTVSVVIPVGPGHGRYLQDALDSLLSQTCQQWEAIVVDDGAGLLEPSEYERWLAGFPFVRFFDTPKPESGPAAARNIGIREARGRYVVCLDADDVLLPTYLEKCLAMAPRGKEYVYTDRLTSRPGQPLEVYQFREFDCEAILEKSLHDVTIFAPREAYLELPFDETLPGWEDWDHQIRMAIAGWCGIRIAEPLTVYRLNAGARREANEADQKNLVDIIYSRYGEYIEGEKEMACSGCSRRQTTSAQKVTAASTPATGVGGGDLVLVLYTTANIAMHTVRGGRTGTKYGRHKGGEKFYMYSADQLAQPHLFARV